MPALSIDASGECIATGNGDLRRQHERAERVDRILFVGLVEVLDAGLPLEHQSIGSAIGALSGDAMRTSCVNCRCSPQLVRVASGSGE